MPEITPLGLGFADTYLGLVFAAGSIPATAGSSGLHRIPYANRFQDPEFARSPGTESRAFRVERENWSLKVQIPPAAEARGSGEESATVVESDLDITVSPDRSLLGRAVYETRARTGRFLVASLPEASTVLWSTVDQTPVWPLRSAEGRWLVPLGDQGPYRVSLFWSEPSAGAATSTGGWSLTLPQVGTDRVSTLVTVHLPDGLTIKPSPPDLEPAAPDRVALERADQISRQITEFIAQMDRSSGRDRERVASLLISHDLALRAAERSLRWSERQGDPARKERAERDLQVIQSTRKAVLESLRAAAMDDEIEAAQSYLGASPGNARSTARVTVPEPVGLDRLRDLGQPSSLIGFSAGLNEPPTTINGAFDSQVRLETETADRARSLLMLGILIALGLAAITRPGADNRVVVLLAATLGLLAFIGGPLVAGAGFILAAAGWYTRPQSPPPPSRKPLPTRVVTTG